MKVRVLKDATLTVTANQEIDVPDKDVDLLIRHGFVEVVKEKPKKKKKAE